MNNLSRGGIIAEIFAMQSFYKIITQRLLNNWLRSFPLQKALFFSYPQLSATMCALLKDIKINLKNFEAPPSLLRNNIFSNQK